MAKPQDTPSHNVLPELIIPAMALIFTVYYLTTITEVPWIAQASALTVSALLVLAILAFAVRTTLRVRRGIETLSIGEAATELASQSVNRTRLMLFALTIGYVVALPYLGFSLTTFLLIFSGILMLSSTGNWLRAFLVALTCTAVGYLAFIQLFNIRFPFGPIEQLLSGLQ